MMKEYASKEKTITFLLNLGFTEVVPGFFDSPGSDEHGAITQVYIYVCGNGYCCVDVDGGYMAPVVWSGPKADWDNQDPGEDFVNYLNTNHPGWR